MDPAMADAWSNLGSAYHHENDLEDALGWCVLICAPLYLPRFAAIHTLCVAMARVVGSLPHPGFTGAVWTAAHKNARSIDLKSTNAMFLL